MASLFSKKRDYNYLAKRYTEVNQFQLKHGERLLVSWGLEPGKKVLDMGCGTGELTSFIANQVGNEGFVVGIDPDEERIKIARQSKPKRRQNLSFVVGDSSSYFPHSEEEYYDIHFSSFVFHWLTTSERSAFLNTAQKCLKPGGMMLMNINNKVSEMFPYVPKLLPDDEINNNTSPIHVADKSATESMLKDLDFEILCSKCVSYDYIFPSLDCFLGYICSSSYIEERLILPEKKKAFSKKFVREDGTIFYDLEFHQIVAKKLAVDNSF